jgi:hypothetical protein
MQPITTELEPYLQKQIDAGSTGLDIIHGHLKVLMVEAEEQLYLNEQAEEESGEAMDSMERRYWEGVTETLGDIYALTYQLSFAIAERNKNE